MTRVLILSLLILAGSTLATADDAGSSTKDLEASVVKIYVSANPPDLLSPWQKAGVELATGSGVVIAKSRVLTDAHVVEDAVSIELKRSNSGQRHVAEVAYHRAIKIHYVGVQLHQQRIKDVPPVPTCECRLFAI